MLRRLSAPTSANAYILLVITCICWAGNFVVGRALAGVVPPVTLAFLRWTGASLLILAVAAPDVIQDWPAIRRHWPMLLLLGVLGSASFNTLQYIALVETTATNAALINASAPVLIALAGFVLNGERLRALQGLGLAISLVGVVIILSRGDPARIGALGLNRGDLIMLFAVAIWAVYTALLRRRPAITGLSLAAVTYVLAAALNAPLAAAELAAGARVSLSVPVALAVLYTAVFPSFLAYLCYNRGVEIVGGARAGAFMNLVPLLATQLAVLFLGEQPRLFHALGFAAIIVGVLLTARQR